MTATTPDRERFLRAVGTRVRTLRTGRGWSQAETARRAAMDRTFLGRLERGTGGVNIDRLPPLAAALGVEPHALIPTLSEFAAPTPPEPPTAPTPPEPPAGSTPPRPPTAATPPERSGPPSPEPSPAPTPPGPPTAAVPSRSPAGRTASS
jgi:outer membrane biosynthesis protein TonB